MIIPRVIPTLIRVRRKILRLSIAKNGKLARYMPRGIHAYLFI